MPTEKHSLMDGRLHVYRRENSRFWQCSTYLNGRNHRETTKETNLSAAKEFARDWYMEKYADDRRRRRGMLLGEIPSDAASIPAAPYHDPLVKPDRRRRPVAAGPTFRQAADTFTKEYKILMQGQRNDHYIDQKEKVTKLHLLPFFGDKALSEITAGLIQEYRVHRVTIKDKDGNPLMTSPRNPKAKSSTRARST